MTQTLVYEARPGRKPVWDQVRDRLLARRDWMVVLAIWACSRVWSTALLSTLFVAGRNGGWDVAAKRSGGSFFKFSALWDTVHYRTIAQVGYPEVLPLDDTGHVDKNAWAFLPVYPQLVRAVMRVTGIGFYPVAVLVATAFGAVAALVLFALLRETLGRRKGFWAVTLFCFGPLGFLLQVAYAETIFLTLFFAAILALRRQRYLLVGALGCVAAFTRPGALALALALGIVLFTRLRARMIGRGAVLRGVLAAMAISAAGLSWPLIAAAVTGTPGAYLQTETAWWVGYIGRVEFLPLTPWFLMAQSMLGPFGIAVVLVILVGAVWVFRHRRLKATGLETHASLVSYALYLFAVFLPQQSTLRLLMPLAPALAALPTAESRRWRYGVLALCLLAQPALLFPLWMFGYP